jgi:flagellar motor switch protein FliM
MSETENNLPIEKFKQLLAAVGSQPAPGGEQVKYTEYDFRKAHYFNLAQLDKLRDFAVRAGKSIAARFASFYSNNFDVSLSGIEQQYTADYFKARVGAAGNGFSLVFGSDVQHPAGLVDVPEQAAIHWLKGVLGDSDSQQQGELSQLEQSFLFDIVLIFVNALNESCKPLGFKPCGSVVKGFAGLDVPPTEALCTIGYDVKKTGTEDSFHIDIAVVAGRLDAAAEKAAQVVSKPAPDFLTGVITHHIADVVVPLTIKFDSTMLTFEEVMNVQPNDVIVLDRKITDHAAVFLMGRKIFDGRLARSEQNKALVINGPVA